MPALLTRTFRAPNVCYGYANGGSPAAFVGDIEVHESSGVAEFLGEFGAFVVEHVTDDDARTFGDEGTGLCCALAPRASRDERDLALQPCGHDCAVRSSPMPTVSGTCTKPPSRTVGLPK